VVRGYLTPKAIYLIVVAKKMKKGFTLIELLVVVAIIGILAAVGTPIFQGFIEDSKEAKIKQVCSNVRSDINSAFFYCSLNPNKNLPPHPDAQTAACDQGTWTIANYVYQKHAGESQWTPSGMFGNGNTVAVVGLSKRNTPGDYQDGRWIGYSSQDAVGIRTVRSYYINNKPSSEPDYIELSCKDMFNAPYAIQMWEIYRP